MRDLKKFTKFSMKENKNADTEPEIFDNGFSTNLALKRNKMESKSLNKKLSHIEFLRRHSLAQHSRDTAVFLQQRRFTLSNVSAKDNFTLKKRVSKIKNGTSDVTRRLTMPDAQCLRRKSVQYDDSTQVKSTTGHGPIKGNHLDVSKRITNGGVLVNKIKQFCLPSINTKETMSDNVGHPSQSGVVHHSDDLDTTSKFPGRKLDHPFADIVGCIPEKRISKATSTVTGKEEDEGEKQDTQGDLSPCEKFDLPKLVSWASRKLTQRRHTIQCANMSSLKSPSSSDLPKWRKVLLQRRKSAPEAITPTVADMHKLGFTKQTKLWNAVLKHTLDDFRNQSASKVFVCITELTKCRYLRNN